MLSIYLNSLHNLVVHHNPLSAMVRETWMGVRALWNLRRNLGRVQQKLLVLEQRVQTVEAYVNNSQLQPKRRFDVTR